MFEGIWWDLVLALVGGGVMTQGILGLSLGGNLPGIRVPRSLVPLAQFVHVLTLFIGLTLLLDRGDPDLIGRAIDELR